MQKFFIKNWKTFAAYCRIGGRFNEGVMWSIVGTLFTQGSVFLTNIFIARLLGKEIFGELGMIQHTLLTLTSIAQIATGLAATKYVAEYREMNKARAGRVLGLCSVLTIVTGVVATALLAVGAPWLSEHVLRAPHLSAEIYLSAGFVLFAVMNTYQIGALAGLESYKSLSLFGAILGVAHMAICLGLAFSFGLDGVLAGIVISAVLRWGVYGALLKREISKRGITINRREGMQEREILFRFMLPGALTGLTSMPALWLGNAFLVRQPGGYSEMGLYNAVNNLRVLVLFLPALVNSVTVSLINSHKGAGNLQSYKAAYFLNLKLTLLLAILGAASLYWAGEWALHFFGSDFVGVHLEAMILLLAVSVIFEAAGVAIYQLIQGHEKMWVSLYAIALPRDILIVIAAYSLTPLFGGAGLAGAYAMGCLFGLIIKLVISYKMNLHNKV